MGLHFLLFGAMGYQQMPASYLSSNVITFEFQTWNSKKKRKIQKFKSIPLVDIVQVCSPTREHREQRAPSPTFSRKGHSVGVRESKHGGGWWFGG